MISATPVWLTVALALLTPQGSEWHNDYGAAMRLARQSSRMLLVWFDDGETHPEWLEQLDPRAEDYHDQFVLARIPVEYTAPVGGEPVVVLDHEAFAELAHRSGLAIIDLADANRPTFGFVVSVYPFSNQTITRAHFRVLVDLPVGSLTERSLIFAVRTHPDHPQSTAGRQDERLSAEATSHSAHQARIINQGHHGWGTRFHRINAQLPSDTVAAEVCAESWPGQGLMAAARECVRSWRSSSGHWQAVRQSHAAYGYDMKRGRNGVWYATGIFAQQR